MPTPGSCRGQNPEGETALLCAAKEGNADIALFLLK
jgi:ankyrin repeat protein